MQGLIEVIEGNLGNSIQDQGRFGYRHMGITVSGCLDPMLARCANALVGNGADCACIEIRALGPVLQVRQGRVRLALAGDVSATLRRSDGSALDIPAWTSITLDPRDILEIGFVAGGTAYLAVSGGIASPVQLGSRSTYQRAMIGGIGGRPISTGNLLPCSAQVRREYREQRNLAWEHGSGPLRVLTGPQDGHFKPQALAALVSSDYHVTPQMDRMGVRLEGAALEHIRPEAADIVSDGVTPGVLQVPGNGQPIILLADCQTVGGYPKIATVISADLPRLGQLKAGDNVRFSVATHAQAQQALREREARWQAWADGISAYLPETTSINAAW